MDASAVGRTRRPEILAHRFEPAVAGALAGLVAGVVYIAVQLVISTIAADVDTLAPLYRKAAMLLGSDAASGTATSGAWGIALLIHFCLAALFGRLVERAVRGRKPAAAALWGSLIGMGLYAVNFHVIAPSAFPWFSEAAGPVTAFNHVLFGAVAASVSLSLGRTTPLASDET